MHVLLANQKNENEIFWMNNNINMLTNFEIISEAIVINFNIVLITNF